MMKLKSLASGTGISRSNPRQHRRVKRPRVSVHQHLIMNWSDANSNQVSGPELGLKIRDQIPGHAGNSTGRNYSQPSFAFEPRERNNGGDQHQP